MAFRYEQLNLAVLDDAREVFAKPATEWTEREYQRAVMAITAMQFVADYYKGPK